MSSDWATIYRWADGWTAARPLTEAALQELSRWSDVPRSDREGLLKYPTFVLLDPQGVPRAGYVTVSTEKTARGRWMHPSWEASRSALVRYTPRTKELVPAGTRYFSRKIPSLAHTDVFEHRDREYVGPFLGVHTDETKRWRALLMTALIEPACINADALPLLPRVVSVKLYEAAAVFDADPELEREIQALHAHRHRLDLVSDWREEHDPGTWDDYDPEEYERAAQDFFEQHGFRPGAPLYTEKDHIGTTKEELRKLIMGPIGEVLIEHDMAISVTEGDVGVDPYVVETLDLEIFDPGHPELSLKIHLLMGPFYGMRWLIGFQSQIDQAFAPGGHSLVDALENLSWLVPDGQLEAWLDSDEVLWGEEVVPMSVYTALDTESPLTGLQSEFIPWYEQILGNP